MIDEKKLAEWEEHIRILRGFYPTAADDVALELIAEVRRLRARIEELEGRRCDTCGYWDVSGRDCPLPESGCSEWEPREEESDE